MEIPRIRAEIPIPVSIAYNSIGIPGIRTVGNIIIEDTWLPKYTESTADTATELIIVPKNIPIEQAIAIVARDTIKLSALLFSSSIIGVPIFITSTIIPIIKLIKTAISKQVNTAKYFETKISHRFTGRIRNKSYTLRLRSPVIVVLNITEERVPPIEPTKIATNVDTGNPSRSGFRN